MAVGLVLRMAWREQRGAGRHFASLVACLALGVAALVAVASFGTSLERSVARSAKALMAADVEIRSTQPLSPAARRDVETLEARGVEATRVLELAAMAQARGAAQLVEIKAVESAYPFYGALATDPDQPLASLIGGGRALVHDSLLRRLGVAVGDRLRVGAADLTISGRILGEPDRSAGIFALGPRVLIAAADLPLTGLVQPGSRVRHRTLLRLPDGLDPLALRDDLASRLPDPGLRVTTFRQAQPGLRRFWDQLGTYLGLTGLVALLVGGIGVASSVRAWVRDKVPTIAILKCLGAGWRHILAVYLAQTALLGAGGSLLGAIAGAGLQWALAPVLAPLLPLDVVLVVSPLAAFRGIAMGVGVTLLCALWPLLEIRDVPPAIILRREVEPRRPGRRPWAVAAAIGAGLAALALWQAGSLAVGGLFIGGLAVGLGLLTGAARLARLGARRGTPLARSLAWRHAMANLSRPGSQAEAVLVTLGLAIMLVVAVALLERDLRREISERGSERAPSFFFVDVQADQAPALARLLAPHVEGGPAEIIPVVRARLTSVKGATVERDAGRRDEQWYLTREYALTWAATPPGRNTVVAGRWWTPGEAAREALVSVEEEIARTLGVGLGDSLGFDVQGVTITGRVASLRKVDWRSLNANFFVIFSPGALDGAPLTYIATARVTPEDEALVQSAVAAAFPNVSAVPVREVLDRAAAMVDQIALCIRLVGGVSVLAGLVVLAGALAVTRAQRLYESLILRAVGATRGYVARAFALEYSLLGLGAGLAGTALAAALAGGVERWVLDLPGTWQPVTLVLGVVGAAALALLVGALGTFRLLGHKPLSALRGE